MRRTMLFAAVFVALTVFLCDAAPAAAKKPPCSETMQDVNDLEALKQFFNRCGNKPAESIRAYVAKGRDINEVDKAGNALLHYAAESCDDAELIDFLVAKGAKVDQPGTGEVEALENEEDEDGRPVRKTTTRAETALFKAAKHRHFKAALALIKHGATVKGQANEIMTAASQGPWTNDPMPWSMTPEAVKLLNFLLRSGADPNHVDEKGNAVLGRLLWRSEPVPEALDLLLRRGANPNVGLKGWPPLCTWKLKLWEAEKLVKAGAKVNIVAERGLTPLHETEDPAVAEFLIAKGADMNARAERVGTPLANAIEREHFAVAKVLLNHLPTTALSGDRGEGLLARLAGELASWHTDVGRFDRPEEREKKTKLYTGGVEILELLMQHGASPNARDEKGRTALFHISALHAETSQKICRLLLAHGADPRLADNEGRTVLHEYREIPPEILDALIAAGADVKARDRHGNTVLHGRTDAANVKALLDRGAEVDAVNDEGRSPLAVNCHTFSQYDQKPDVAELLIEAGAEVNRPDADGMTPLLLAVGFEGKKKDDAAAGDKSSRHQLFDMGRDRKGNRAAVRPLLDHGANPDTRTPDGEPLLVDAAGGFGGGYGFQVLVEHGANANAQDKDGNSALHIYAAAGFFFGSGDHFRPENVEALMSHGAQINLKNHSGLTPLDIAESLHRKNLAELFRKYGGKTTAPADRRVELKRENNRFIVQDPKLLERYLAQGGAIDAQDEFQATLLHYAASLGYPDSVKLLLKRGANLQAEANGRTPLQLAAQAGQPETIALLLAAGAKIEPPVLVEAAAAGSLPAVRLLLEAKADVNAVVKDQGFEFTALDHALLTRHLEIANYLVDHGATPVSQGNHTVVMACEYGDRAFVKKLLARGGDIRTNFLWPQATPLAAAAAGGKKDIVELLLARGYPANDLKNCQAALAAAIREKRLEIAEILIRRGAAFTEENDVTMNTTLALAFLRAHDREDLVELLKKNNAAFEKQQREHPERKENGSREDDE